MSTLYSVQMSLFPVISMYSCKCDSLFLLDSSHFIYEPCGHSTLRVWWVGRSNLPMDNFCPTLLYPTQNCRGKLYSPAGKHSNQCFYGCCQNGYVQNTFLPGCAKSPGQTWSHRTTTPDQRAQNAPEKEFHPSASDLRVISCHFSFSHVC